MTDTDIIRVELGLEVEPGRWRYSAPAYGVEGCSHQPLLDACRQIKSLWPETLSQQIGIYRRGKDKPELLCTVEVGAARTISESNSRGPYFAKFEPFDPAKWPTPDDGSASEDVEAHQPRKTQKTDVGTQARPAQRPSGETSDDYPGVVAVLDGGRSRVIVARDGIQWIVQHWYGNQWRSRSFCCTKTALIRCCGGSTPELDALPDRCGDRVALTTDTQEAARLSPLFFHKMVREIFLTFRVT